MNGDLITSIVVTILLGVGFVLGYFFGSRHSEDDELQFYRDCKAAEKVFRQRKIWVNTINGLEQRVVSICEELP